LPPKETGALQNKTVFTNTTTEADRSELKERGVRCLITSTPRFEGRTFGTNVMEALLVARAGRTLSPTEYAASLLELGWTPHITDLTV
jgi:hypothetical protein